MAKNSAINMASPVNWGHPLTRGLVGWWLVMPGTTSGSRLTDITNPGPSGNHATLTSMDNSDWVGSNRSGGWGALRFDDTDQAATIGNVNLVDGEVQATFSFWFTDDARVSTDTPLANFGSSQSQLLIRKDDTTKFNVFVAASTADTGDNKGTTPSLGYAADEWHSLVVEFDGSGSDNAARLKISYDGVQQSLALEGTIPAILTSPSTSAWNIGRWPAIDGWDGLIDDVSIWNRALTSNEVMGLYQLSRQGYPGLLNRIGRRAVIAAPAGAGIRNPFGGPMVVRNPLGA